MSAAEIGTIVAGGVTLIGAVAAATVSIINAIRAKSSAESAAQSVKGIQQ
jgi:hypothetical protein